MTAEVNPIGFETVTAQERAKEIDTIAKIVTMGAISEVWRTLLLPLTLVGLLAWQVSPWTMLASMPLMFLWINPRYLRYLKNVGPISSDKSEAPGS